LQGIKDGAPGMILSASVVQFEEKTIAKGE
jgi:hypothetical protein